MPYNRRDFIRQTALAASGTLLVPSFINCHAQQSSANSTGGSRSRNIFIVVQLTGGNDGLNTIVPYRNDLYYQARPQLAIQRKTAIGLSEELGFHPALQPLQALYDAGEMSIINNVGYPEPDRSHFRSMDIWETASGSKEYLDSGWLGRWLDQQTEANTAHRIVEADTQLSLAVQGQQWRGFALGQPKVLGRAAQNTFLQKVAASHQEAHSHEMASYLYKVLADTQSSAAYLAQQSRLYKAQGQYPAGKFGRDLRQVAELIGADSDTQVYYVTLTGFDTHNNQDKRQARLLQEYAEGMAALVSDLKHHKVFQDTLILTFSEFGRRVRQNASGGTDHGAASNVFLMGGSLKKAGFYNEGPDLSRLDDGDLIFGVDFRQIYATILEKWLGTPATGILGGNFAPLGVI